MKRSSTIAIVATLTGALAFVSPAAHAAAPGDSNGGRLTFGVQTSHRNTPDHRPHFDYTVAPGGEVVDYLAISNYSNQQLALQIYPGDAFTTVDGGFDLTPPNRKPKDVGAWIDLKTRALALAAHTRSILPFRLTVPQNATPGDHVGGIIVSLSTQQRNQRGDTVTVEHRLAERVYLRVPGAVTPGLTVSATSASYDGTLNPFGRGSVTIRYTLRNTGNVIEGAKVSAAASNLFGIVTADLPNVPEILPGSATQATVTLHHVFPEVWASAKVNATAVLLQRDSASQPPQVSDGRFLWTVPWPLLLLLALIAAAIWERRRRRRQRRQGAHAASRRATPPPIDRKRTEVMSSVRTVKNAVVLGAAGMIVWSSAPAAHAATSHYLGISPKRGTDTSAVTLTTPRACSKGTNIEAVIYGHGFPKSGQNIVGNTAITAYQRTKSGGMRIPLSMTLRDIGNLPAHPVRYHGEYRLVVKCRNRVTIGTLDRFAGVIRFATPHKYAAIEPKAMPRGTAALAPNDPGAGPLPDSPQSADGGAGQAGAGAQAVTGLTNGAVNAASGLPTVYVATHGTSPWKQVGLALATGGMAVVAAVALLYRRQRRSLTARS